jgi:hypothetical protein
MERKILCNKKLEINEVESYVKIINCANAVDLKNFLFPVPVCAITASGVPGGTLVSMNRFSTLCR